MMTRIDREPLGYRQWPFPNLAGDGYVYSLGGELWVLGAFHLTPDEARALADVLRQAADDITRAG